MGKKAERPDGEDTHILIICISGCGYVIHKGKTTSIPAGHLLLVPAGVPHTYGSTEIKSWSIKWLHFSGDLSHHYFSHLTDTIHVAPIPIEDHEHVLKTYQELYRTVTAGFDLNSLVHSSQVLGFLLGLLFFVPSKNGAATSLSAKAIVTMNEHLADQLTLDDLAADAGMSKAHFSVVFKKETGFSPIDYYIHLKIRRACRLLDDPSSRVGEVSRRIGIDNIHYFSRLFTKVMGVSPTSYRKLIKG